MTHSPVVTVSNAPVSSIRIAVANESSVACRLGGASISSRRRLRHCVFMSPAALSWETSSKRRASGSATERADEDLTPPFVAGGA
ncbi:MAG: hypothetical protein WDN25_15055 [Acetobacteraceae bacterium]